MKKAKLAQMNKQLERPEKKTSKISKEIIEANIPRGERAQFFKLTITMPYEMLSALKSIGLYRKSQGAKDTDTSSLIREAVASFISNNNS